MPKRWTVRLFAVGIVFLGTPTGIGQAAEGPLTIEMERELAAAVVPSLQKTVNIRCSTKSVFGTALGGCPHPLTYLRTEALPGQGLHLVLIWFVRTPAGAESPHFVCDECAAWVLPALVDSHNGKHVVRAIAGNLTQSSGRELWVPTSAFNFGKTPVFPIDKIYRKRGLIRQERQFWIQKKTRLQPIGTVPIHGGNEGVCGRLQDVIQTQKTLGGKDVCGTVWRFDAELSTHSKGLVAKEILVEAARPKFVRKSVRRDVLYVLTNQRLVAPKKSLFPK